MSEIVNREHLRVTCPYCKVKRREPCRTNSGKPVPDDVILDDDGVPTRYLGHHAERLWVARGFPQHARDWVLQ